MLHTESTRLKTDQVCVASETSKFSAPGFEIRSLKWRFLNAKTRVKLKISPCRIDRTTGFVVLFSFKILDEVAMTCPAALKVFVIWKDIVRVQVNINVKLPCYHLLVAYTIMNSSARVQQDTEFLLSLGFLVSQSALSYGVRPVDALHCSAYLTAMAPGNRPPHLRVESRGVFTPRYS